MSLGLRRLIPLESLVQEGAWEREENSQGSLFLQTLWGSV